MIYAPHILLKKVVNESRDEYGRISHSNAEWLKVCKCRCDDNSTTELYSDTGKVYRPKYHVVCEGSINVDAGDYLRCIYPDGRIRAEGKCEQPKRLNYLQYSELWM